MMKSRLSTPNTPEGVGSAERATESAHTIPKEGQEEIPVAFGQSQLERLQQDAPVNVALLVVALTETWSETAKVRVKKRPK